MSKNDEDTLEYQFATSTSCHGAAKIATSRHPVVRVMWIIVFTGAWCLCIWQCVDRVSAYFDFHTNTQISRKYETKLDFPAVTICNFNRLRQSQVSPEELNYLWAVLALSEAIDEETQELLSNYFNFSSIDWNAFNATVPDYASLVRRAGFVLDSTTLLDCFWQGQKCYAENFTHVFTTYGNCWTFNGDTNNLLYQTAPGSGNGLRVVIDIQKSEYTENPIIGNPNEGLAFHVHHPSEPVSMYTDGLAVPPGMHAYASVQQIQNSNKGPPYGPCDPEREKRQLEFYSTYTLHGCIKECKAKAMIRSCNCHPISFPGDRTTPYCGPQKLSECILPTFALLDIGTLLGECDCTIPCNYKEYPVSTTYAGFPNDKASAYFENRYNLSSGYAKGNLVNLDVFYKDLSYNKFAQHQAVTKSGLVSDIGGQLGFFIGVSVITLAEFADYLGRKLRLVCTRKKRMEMEDNKEDKTGEPDNTIVMNCN